VGENHSRDFGSALIYGVSRYIMFKELLDFQNLSFYGNKIKTNRSIEMLVVFPKVKYIPFLLLPFIIHHLNPSIQKS